MRTHAGGHSEDAPVSITVQLHVGLGRFRPHLETGRALRVQVSAGSTVEAVMTGVCGLPSGLRLLVTVNGRTAASSDVVQEGDRVRFFMPLSGG